MNEQIQRLGFDAWAQNLFVNAIEDFVSGDDGSASVESDDFRVNIWWSKDTVTATVTAYAEGRWQTYDDQIKRRYL